MQGKYAFAPKSTDPFPYKNSYHNSLFYVDKLVGTILEKLQDLGRKESMWIIITGDHGEEFNENGLGFWGHGSNFSKWQTHTPMLIKHPWQSEGKTEKRLSLHQDIVPTLMEEALGCITPASSYSDGINLYREYKNRGTIISSYYNTAYYYNEIITVLPLGKQYLWNDMRQRPDSAPQNWNRLMMDEEMHFVPDYTAVQKRKAK
jgi:membrane-anchored protein YejM (alkaline phosphatase superfamily)